MLLSSSTLYPLFIIRSTLPHTIRSYLLSKSTAAEDINEVISSISTYSTPQLLAQYIVEIFYVTPNVEEEGRDINYEVLWRKAKFWSG